MSGTPGSSACASTPMPIRSSDTEHLRQLVEAARSKGRDRRLVEVAPRAATDMHRDHPGGKRRDDIVVDAVADVRNLLRRDAGLVDHAPEELRSRFLDSPARGRAHEVDVLAHELLGLDRR